MNQRLFELIQSQNGLCGLLWSEEDKQEFAELIVQECARVADRWVDDEDNGTNLVSERLKQHFGVKQ